MTDFRREFRIEGDYLLEQVSGCNCACVDTGYGVQHEPHCGWEPVAHMDDVHAALSASCPSGSTAADCSCTPFPQGTGPEVDCPVHGLDAETMRWLQAVGLCPVGNHAELSRFLAEGGAR